MEQYTIKDLMERYNLKTRQSIYQWCDGLNLKLYKGERNRAYATPEQVEQLDQLKEHLDKGGTIASFTPVIDTEIDTSSNLVHQSVDSTVDSPDWLEMVGAIAGAISPPNPISHWDRLYLAAERGYILSTSEVRFNLELFHTTHNSLEKWQHSMELYPFSQLRHGKIISTTNR